MRLIDISSTSLAFHSPLPRLEGVKGCQCSFTHRVSWTPESICTHRHLFVLQENKEKYSNPLVTCVLTMFCSRAAEKQHLIGFEVRGGIPVKWDFFQSIQMQCAFFSSHQSTGWMTLGNDKQYIAHTQSAWIIILLIIKHVVWICVQHFCWILWGTQGWLVGRGQAD